jgi:hypothetical protein
LPSLIQQLAAAQAQAQLRPTQKRVVVYSPGRPVPGNVRQQAQPRQLAPRPQGAREPGVVRGDAIARSEQAYLNTPEARKQREAFAQKQAEAQAPDQPWWKQGLGMIIGNPVVKNALLPLGVLGIPRRAIDLGIETLAEHSPVDLESLPTWAKVAMTANPLTMAAGAASWVDTDRTKADDRSFYEKVISPSSDYGFGQLLNPDLPSVVGGLGGLYGDVALDPLTYVTAGGGKIAQEGAKTGQEIVLHGGKAERLAELSRLSERPLEEIERLAPDIQKAGARGLNSASPELREALDLTAPKLRFAGQAIPGTERIAGPITKATGLAREQLQRVPAIQALSRGPKGLEAATNVLTRYGTEKSVPRALTKVRLDNLGRVAAGEMTSRGNRLLYQMVKQDFKGLSKDAIRTVTKEAETTPGQNAINQFFAKVAKVYEEVSGDTIAPYLQDPDHYLPHMLAPSFRRMLKEQLGKNNPVVKDFMDQSGFFADDLLEGSGYIEKARQLKPNVDPITGAKSPAEFPIAGQKITLRTGTVDELNEQLRKVFPGFKGNFYETDPVRIGEAYVSSLAKGAGARRSASTLADTGSELVERIGGPGGRGQALGQALDEVNQAHNAQQPIMDTIRQGFTPGETIPPVTPPAAVPQDVAGIHVGDFFDEEVNREATREQQQFFRNQGKAWAKDVTKETREVQETAAKDLATLRTNWSKGLKADLQGAKKQIGVLDKRIQAYEDSLKAMGAHRQATHDQLTAFLIGIRKDIDDLAEEMSTKTRYWKGRVTKATKEANAEMEQRWRRLRGIEAKAQNVAEKAPGKLNYELRRRVEQATAPARAAQQKIDEITASIPGRPSDDRLAAAQEFLENRKIDVTDPHTPLRDEYRELLSKEPAKRTAKDKKRITELQQQLRQPRQTSVMTEFDKDTQRIAEIIEQQEAGVADDATKEALRKERTALRRKFQQGGTHEPEKRARATMAEYKQWEDDVAKATAGPRSDLAQAQRRQQLAIDSIHESLRAKETIEFTQQRAASAKQRSDVMRGRIDAPFDPQRDLAGTVGATRRQGVEAVQEISRQRELARDLHDEVLDKTRTELRKVDADMADQQVAMVRDAQERQPLLAKRDEADQLLTQLKGTEKQIKSGPKGGVKYKPDEMIDALDEIASVAKANPNLSDAELTATESVLQAHRIQLERVANNDLTAKQAQALVDKSFQEGKKGLAPVMLAVLNDNWKMMHDGILKQGDVIMDAELHQIFKNLYELDKQPKWFGRTFNALTNLFKTYATLTPGFHVRNALSGIFMNTADGVALKAQFEGAKYWSQFMKRGEEAIKEWPAEIQEAFRAAAGSGAGGQFTEAGVAATSENRLYNALSNNRFTRSGLLGKRGGERVEGALRMGMAIDTVRKGGTVEDALSRISRVHFDYSQVSALDEKMKRIIPFWTFMSRNLPLQVSEMWTKPRTYAVYESALRNLGSAPEQYTPQYWLDAGGRNTGINIPDLPGQSGGSLFFQPDLGYTRIQNDINNLAQAGGGDLGGLLAAGNPIVTAPLEFATKHDLYTGQSYGPTDNVNADPITTTLGRLFGQTNEAGQVSIPFQNLLRSINPVQDRTIRLAPQIAGGTDRDKSRQLESYARLLGFPGRVLTPQAQQSEVNRRFFEMKDEQDRIRKMLELQAKAG